MSDATRDGLAATLLVGVTTAFVVGAVVSPPDPFTQVAVLAGALPLVLVASYLLARRGGWEAVAGERPCGGDHVAFLGLTMLGLWIASVAIGRLAPQDTAARLILRSTAAALVVGGAFALAYRYGLGTVRETVDARRRGG